MGTMISQRGLDVVTAKAQTAKRRHDRGLLLIGLFKLGKSLLFFIIGVGVVKLFHRDISDVVMRVAMALKFDPESGLVAMVLNKVDLIDMHKLKLISAAAFGYSAVALTEGVGLVLEKVWAEYLTLCLTIAFLPWELYEIARKPNIFRIGVFVINLAVLWYLVWLLRRKKSSASVQA
ncbi:DUF2127 domain-containing protein [Edaphobacter sp.]|uniref:DUF2127 domain-containing protein n=1 Tax=Edaphobacter sp. TaxID=1934404 RepID=UPI002DBC4421|nr:DUF2127 domain-containing protein [Edaphobacter sp.]HEU5342212.1 DUF2127 domain-containing protein [Edaphobacter sp.]